MHTIFLPDWTESNKEVLLSEQEGKHTIQVLRMKTGDTVRVINGTGLEGKATLEVRSKKEATISISEVAHHNYPNTLLHLAIAPTKQLERMEWLLEKCTEIGVARFSFILCKNSERRNLNMDRLERIVISATKQSGRIFLPKIHPLMSLETFTANHRIGWIAHCREDMDKKAIGSFPYTTDAPILIGPEGDFTKEEIAATLKTGYKSITLGQSRLRTETAALVACVQTITEIQRHEKL
jgi:16S rRNA (uracil1498-N3)-methyltransferase